MLGAKNDLGSLAMLIRPVPSMLEGDMEPKNLLFILSDEHNRDSLGCYGHSLVQTPHLDRLAAGGVRFDSAYTNCPICVPARASLATGRYVADIGYWDNAFPYEGRVPGWGHHLAAQGHIVDSIGKLHYRGESDDDGFTNKIIPLNVVDGVGDVMGSIRDEIPHREGMRDGVKTAGPGESTYLDYDVDIARKSCDWLKAAAAGEKTPAGKPWMLFASFVCPHPPFIAPPELYDLYPLDQIPLPVQNRVGDQPDHPAIATLRDIMCYADPFSEEEVRRVTAAYYGACTHLDLQIGKVLETLEQTGLAETTRIIYTSDHGESMGRRGLWGKFTMYEESVAVPFIMAGPDLPSAESTDDPVSLVDCYQTILEAVGEPLTEVERNELPGSSLWQVARGESLDRSVMSEYHAVASRGGSFMLRRGNFKYVHYVGVRPQLFDLAADPLETNDLAEDPTHAEELQALEAELRSIVDPDDVDARAKSDQRSLVDQHGGRETVLQRGSFVNSPVPGEDPQFRR